MGIFLPLDKRSRSLRLLSRLARLRGAQRLNSGLKKLKKKVKLIFKRGSLSSLFLYFAAFFAVFFVILTIGFSLAAKYPRYGGKTLLSAAISESSSQSVPAPFMGANEGLLFGSPELMLLGNSSLLAAAPTAVITPQALGALFLTDDAKAQRKVVTEYVVEAGDTLSSLVKEFDVSLDTLLWANDLTKSSSLKVGQKLVIPPVSGVIHHVKEKDTISSIAERYKVETEQIIAFNELTQEGSIYIGDIIIVPGGVMPSPTKTIATPNAPLGDSYFICPTGSCRVSQGLHWYNAIDFSGRCGDIVRAAAQGQAQRVALTSSDSRYAFGGAGNHITILHPNGVVTMYGHISTSLVGQGQQVSQGQTIALMGGQPGSAGAGMSTGCHVHFGVTGARNPFSR
ncbi:MAG: putative metalloendopeptidase-like membrane protein [Parcubacteria group bacterium Gr01-1014_30]|nr:MAG: putative metalloendopeptidase-like membrane protein [Parcubacteria group bacterium Gr01-1014_30]